MAYLVILSMHQLLSVGRLHKQTSMLHTSTRLCCQSDQLKGSKLWRGEVYRHIIKGNSGEDVPTSFKVVGWRRKLEGDGCYSDRKRQGKSSAPKYQFR